jgi:signal transduction histidine kinase
MPRDQRIKEIRSAQRMLDSMVALIQKVRKLSSIQSASAAELLRLDLAAAVRSQVSRLVSEHPNRKIKESFGDMPPNCYVLANDLIGDLFGNILSNAIVHNYSEEVEIGISIAGLVDEFAGKTYWKVSISDNGGGIPEEQKTQIFDITSRIGESVGPTGIGLSVVKAIVSLYGGSVWVEDKHPSDISKGSVFQVLLPAA